MRFLGQGPAPVYQNRLAGGTLDVWNRPYNNTDGWRPGRPQARRALRLPALQGVLRRRALAATQYLGRPDHRDGGSEPATLQSTYRSSLRRRPPRTMQDKPLCRSRMLESPFCTPSQRSAASLVVRNPVVPWDSRRSPKGSIGATSACTLESCRHGKACCFAFGP